MQIIWNIWTDGEKWRRQHYCSTNLVILKILSRRRARRTLMPKDMPGLKKPHSTSKMLPTITCREREGIVSLIKTHRNKWACTDINAWVTERRGMTVLTPHYFRNTRSWTLWGTKNVRRQMDYWHCSRSSWRKSGSRDVAPSCTSSETSQSGTERGTGTLHSLQQGQEQTITLLHDETRSSGAHTSMCFWNHSQRKFDNHKGWLWWTMATHSVLRATRPSTVQ